MIADYRLPDGEGAALLPNGRQTVPEYPVVILTGQGDEHIAVETIKAGACDYVIKSDRTLVEMPLIASRALRDWSLVVERQRAEAALHESEERYRLLVECSPDAIAVIDKDCRILFANPATAALLMVPSVDVLLGQPFLEMVDPAERDAARLRIAKMIESGESLPPREYRFTRSDGARVYGAVTSMPLMYEGRRVIQTITRDVTERKRTEAALQRAHDQMESKVAERTRELQAANEKLLELDHLKSMFIASMSHELRTPLNSIIGFTGVILQGMSGKVNDRQRDQLSRVYASARHLLSLVTDVIDISRVEAGKVQVEASDFMLDQLIEESVDLVRKLASDKGLALKIHVAREINMHTDRRRLLQVMLNLVSNAVKYTVRGEVIISAELRGSRVRIKVTDTGVGIAEEALPRLFKPFERLDKLLRVKVLGTGLGLYLSKKLAEELLQGELGVASKYGIGSTFWLELPQKLSLKS